VGTFAMVGAGSVVTHSVPDHGLVIGNPARLVGFVCVCGVRLVDGERQGEWVRAACPACGTEVRIPTDRWAKAATQRGQRGKGEGG
jgi:hypothetical protein